MASSSSTIWPKDWDARDVCDMLIRGEIIFLQERLKRVGADIEEEVNSVGDDIRYLATEGSELYETLPTLIERGGSISEDDLRFLVEKCLGLEMHCSLSKLFDEQSNVEKTLPFRLTEKGKERMKGRRT
jgi:hypothetical protein